MYLRNVSPTVVFHVSNVALDILYQFSATLLTFLIGSHCGNRRENSRAVELVCGYPSKELASQGLIGNDGIAAHNAGHVERIRGCTERDTYLSRLLRQIGRAQV